LRDNELLRDIRSLRAEAGECFVFSRFAFRKKIYVYFLRDLLTRVKYTMQCETGSA